MEMKKGIGCLLIVALLVAAGLFLARFIMGSFSGSSDGSEPGNSSGYSQIYFDDLTNDMTSDIDSAKSKYLDQNITIVGTFDKMNSDGSAKIEGVTDDCIVLSDTGEAGSDSICVVGRMQTSDQREKFKEFTEGETVVVRGKITDINDTIVFMDIDDMQ